MMDESSDIQDFTQGADKNFTIVKELASIVARYNMGLWFVHVFERCFD